MISRDSRSRGPTLGHKGSVGGLIFDGWRTEHNSMHTHLPFGAAVAACQRSTAKRSTSVLVTALSTGNVRTWLCCTLLPTWTGFRIGVVVKLASWGGPQVSDKRRETWTYVDKYLPSFLRSRSQGVRRARRRLRLGGRIAKSPAFRLARFIRMQKAG